MARRKAFEEAAREAYPTLIRAAAALSPNRADAEDAVQEAILRAYGSYGSFRGESSATTWFYGVLMNVLATRRRRLEMEGAAQAEEVEASPTPGPEEAAALSETSRAVVEAIARLPERQREIVTLYYLENMRYTEIAETLGVTMGTVKAALFHAKMNLRQLLAGYGRER